MRRGYNPFVALASQILKLPKARSLIFNSQFGKTLRASSDAVVPLADRDCPPFSILRAVTEYISAPQRMCEPYCRHWFPVVTTKVGRGLPPLSAPRMTGALQGHLRVAGLPSDFTMHCFRLAVSLSKIAGRDGSGQDDENWWLEDGIDSQVFRRGHL